MTCNRVTLGSWAKYTLEKKSGNDYYIKGNNEDTTLGITCDRTTPNSWETFTIK